MSHLALAIVAFAVALGLAECAFVIRAWRRLAREIEADSRGGWW